jgi:hypothetical protein
MPGIDRTASGYAPVAQNTQTPETSSNIIDVGGRKFDDLLRSFKSATGHPDAELRAVDGERGLRVLVPESRASVPSLWTRFKAALSNLPLLSRTGTLRAARFELSSRRLDTRGTHDLSSGIVSAIEAAEGQGDHGVSRAASSRLKLLRQTGGLTRRNVQVVLEAASEKLAQRAANVIVTEMRQQMKEVNERIGVSAKDPVSSARAPNPKSPAHRHKTLFNLCTQIVEEKLGASNAHAVPKDAQALYDNVKNFLQRQQRWPPSDDVDELRGIVAVMYVK